tara:strand:+ start:1682 stop:2020 length:339 start_codon:yes stop_codon:yes gene_type:complete
MTENDEEIIGYWGITKNGDIVCDDVDACIIAGSYEKMEGYLENSNGGNSKELKITKLTYGEIMEGLNAGAACSFDEESYQKLVPLASDEGVVLPDVDFTPGSDGDIKFYTLS